MFKALLFEALLLGIHFLFVFMLIWLGCILLFDRIFRMDKKTDLCTMEEKFVWQKKYKIKTLCKLSEVKKATRKGFFFFCKLCLTLQSGKDVVIFSKCGEVFRFFIPGSRMVTFTYDFDEQANEINQFLHDNNEQYTTKQSLFDGDIWLILIVCVFCVFIFFILYL